MGKVNFIWFIFCLLLSGLAYAGHDRHVHPYLHYRDRPHYGYRMRNFYPDEYFPVQVGANNYYYDDGIYYSYLGGAYVVAIPPPGAVVSSIPAEFQPVVINGVKYYTNNGVYYIHTPQGYEVVTTPLQNKRLP